MRAPFTSLQGPCILLRQIPSCPFWLGTVRMLIWASVMRHYSTDLRKAQVPGSPLPTWVLIHFHSPRERKPALFLLLKLGCCVESRMGCQALGSLRKKEAAFSPSQVIRILTFTPISVYLFVFTEGLDILEFPTLVDYSEIWVYLASQKCHTSPSSVVNCLRSKI